MDARDKNFGLMIPTPYHSSFLGKLVYIDERDMVVAFANVFPDPRAPLAPHLKGLKPLNSSREIIERRAHDSVLFTTHGISGAALERSEYERQHLRLRRH